MEQLVPLSKQMASWNELVQTRHFFSESTNQLPQTGFAKISAKKDKQNKEQICSRPFFFDFLFLFFVSKKKQAFVRLLVCHLSATKHTVVTKALRRLLSKIFFTWVLNDELFFGFLPFLF
jgi:hypothetical protein